MIQINAKSYMDACEILKDNLAPYIDAGWKCTKAEALVDGWKNVYCLKKEDQERILEFDLKESLPYLDILLFTTVSMGLAHDLSLIDDFKKRTSSSGKGKISGILILIVLIGLLWMFSKCSY
jgi:hypothetical protein